MKRFIIQGCEEIEFVVPEHMTLSQILEHFTIFLRSCGYKFDGYATILPVDDWK